MSLILDKINYVYSEGTAYQIQALKDVNLEIKDGQFIGVIGHTGSGKSTLIQHFPIFFQQFPLFLLYWLAFANFCRRAFRHSGRNHAIQKRALTPPVERTKAR